MTEKQYKYQNTDGDEQLPQEESNVTTRPFSGGVNINWLAKGNGETMTRSTYHRGPKQNRSNRQDKVATGEKQQLQYSTRVRRQSMENR